MAVGRYILTILAALLLIAVLWFLWVNLITYLIDNTLCTKDGHIIRCHVSDAPAEQDDDGGEWP